MAERGEGEKGYKERADMHTQPDDLNGLLRPEFPPVCLCGAAPAGLEDLTLGLGNGSPVQQHVEGQQHLDARTHAAVKSKSDLRRI